MKSASSAVVDRVSGVLLLVIALSFFTPSVASSQDANAIWRFTDEAQPQPLRRAAKIGGGPSVYYRSLRADVDLLHGRLREAPEEGESSIGAMLWLPMPDGTLQRFTIERSPVMAPGLAARYPQISTYRGEGIDDPTARVRLDMTPGGFHAMVLSAAGEVYIDPAPAATTANGHYISYYRRDFNAARHLAGHSTALPCDVMGGSASRPASAEPPSSRYAAAPRTTSQRRTYRLAIGATGEYTQYHNDNDPLNGDAKADALAAIVTAVNRITGVFERDLNIRLQLIANNDQIIYTDAATDPFTNDDATLMLEENQQNTDNVIGSANYDIGHLFATGGGGLALVGAICESGFKAQAVSGYVTPTGDPFYIDLVAHEIAHQLNADHTFNGSTGSCGGNRNAATAFEPGSGSTVMSYAGICGEENVTIFADAFFHAGSIQQMVEFTTSASGSSCGQLESTGNNPPTANAGPDLSIPKETPFTLTGSATDPEGQTLIYQWDEIDAGAATDANTYGTDLGSNPLFRSRLPGNSPSRTFPDMSLVLAGGTSKAETLPTTQRILTFRLIVKDGQGGVAEDDRVLNVIVGSGPFRVLQPTTALTLDNTLPQTITWDVAGTDQAPVDCSAVDIRLSDDDGQTFATDLLLATPNDGAEVVTLPNIETTSARVMVSCSDNVFFDVSDVKFEIASGRGTALQPPASSGGTGDTASGGGSTDTDSTDTTDTSSAGGGGGAADVGMLLLVGLLGMGRRRPRRFSDRRL